MVAGQGYRQPGVVPFVDDGVLHIRVGVCPHPGIRDGASVRSAKNIAEGEAVCKCHSQVIDGWKSLEGESKCDS